MIRIIKGNDDTIKILFPYDPDFVAKIKTISGRQWHPEGKYWTIPYDDDALTKVLKLFEGSDIINIYVDPDLMRKDQYCDFDDLRKELITRKYSNKTIKAYMYYNRDFISYSGKIPSEIKNNDIMEYLVYLAERKRVATATLNQAINALKFYYGSMLKKKFVYEIKRPKKDKKLPVILNKEEVAKIINSVDNVKHKAMLMIIYSAGLRVSEVVKLKPEDIDSQRMLIYINGAKGRKDRYTLLSHASFTVLTQYIKEYKPRKWLFEGAKPDIHISIRTVQKIFENACRRAGIMKNVTVHSLRHSFATHLLESGVDLRYIQELLGHANSKTTEIYTHVSMKNLSQIRSPLDDCDLSQNKSR